jgi:hypothetical protein
VSSTETHKIDKNRVISTLRSELSDNCVLRYNEETAKKLNLTYRGGENKMVVRGS